MGNGVGIKKDAFHQMSIIERNYRVFFLGTVLPNSIELRGLEDEIQKAGTDYSDTVTL
jgi:hypothetical protein